MVKTQVTTEMSEPVWMDNEGNFVLEKDAHGCKVMHHLAYPEVYIVMYEVDGNIIQKGDGNKCGDKYICRKVNVPQQKTNSRDKYYIV